MDKQTISATSQDLSTHSSASDDPPSNSKKPLILAVGIVLSVLLLVGGYFLFNQYNTKSKIASIKSFEDCKKAGYPVLQSDPEQCGVPGGKMFYGPPQSTEVMQFTPTLDPTANWKTYTISQKISFKYPADYIIQESSADFFNIYNGPGNMGMSIDARLAGNYADFSTAVNNTKKDLVNPVVENLDNGVKISGKIGPGYREGTDIIIVLYKLNNAAVEVERSNDLIPLETFNKILRSFKLTDQAQVACSIINTHNGTVFTLEVLPFQPNKTLITADILNSQSKLLQTVKLSGPYDSISSPGEKVYNATVPYEKVTGFKFVKLTDQNKNGNSTSLALTLGECTKGME